MRHALLLLVLLTGCKEKDVRLTNIEAKDTPLTFAIAYCLELDSPPKVRCTEVTNNLIAKVNASPSSDWLECEIAIHGARRFAPVDIAAALEDRCCRDDAVRRACDRAGAPLCRIAKKCSREPRWMTTGKP